MYWAWKPLVIDPEGKGSSQFHMRIMGIKEQWNPPDFAQRLGFLGFVHLKHSLIPWYKWWVSLIYCSDPGLFVYCCDFSATAVDLVQVMSVVTYKNVGSFWGQLLINTNLFQLPLTLWLCWKLSGFSQPWCWPLHWEIWKMSHQRL